MSFSDMLLGLYQESAVRSLNPIRQQKVISLPFQIDSFTLRVRMIEGEKHTLPFGLEWVHVNNSNHMFFCPGVSHKGYIPEECPICSKWSKLRKGQNTNNKPRFGGIHTFEVLSIPKKWNKSEREFLRNKFQKSIITMPILYGSRQLSFSCVQGKRPALPQPDYFTIAKDDSQKFEVKNLLKIPTHFPKAVVYITYKPIALGMTSDKYWYQATSLLVNQNEENANVNRKSIPEIDPTLVRKTGYYLSPKQLNKTIKQLIGDTK